MVSYHEGKASEEQCPPSLPVVESFFSVKVFLVAMVSQYKEGKFAPLSQCSHSLNAAFIGLLSLVQLARIIGTWKEFSRINMAFQTRLSLCLYWKHLYPL